MKIVWNKNSINWFNEASAYTGYNCRLSSFLMEYIPHRNTICDMGCGAALIDFEFAKQFEQVTCVDISQEAISSVDTSIKEQNISNMRTVCMDGTMFTESSDTVIALFHGGPNIFDNYYPLAKEQLIIVTHLGKCGTFSPEKHRKAHNFGVPKTKEHLDKLGVKYTYLEQSLEYGQPFHTFEDAMEFMNAYSAPGMTEEEKIENLKNRLVETGEQEYPYYLPNKKEMGIFIINRKENEQIGGTTCTY